MPIIVKLWLAVATATVAIAAIVAGFIVGPSPTVRTVETGAILALTIVFLWPEPKHSRLDDDGPA